MSHAAALSPRRLAPAAVALLIGIVVAGSSQVAEAAKHAKMTATAAAPARVTFPAIPQSAPMTSFRPVDPDECSISAYCDTVPMEVIYPDVPPGDEVLLDIEVAWDDQGESNNLDLFVWDNKQIKQQYGRAEPGDDSWDARDTDYTLIDSSSFSFPERLTLVSPDIRDYNLTILNWGGNNFGYTVTLTMRVEEAGQVYEYQEEEKVPPPSGDSSGGDDGGSVSLSDLEQSDSASADLTPGGSDDPTLAPAFGSADQTLLGIEEREFDSELAGPGVQAAASAALEKPDPPSGFVLALWLVVIPGLLGAALAVWIRRQRAVLAFPA